MLKRGRLSADVETCQPNTWSSDDRNAAVVSGECVGDSSRPRTINDLHAVDAQTP